jgi:predicted transcriptional regulator
VHHRRLGERISVYEFARSSSCATTSNAMPRTLSIGISSLPDALDRFEAAWHLTTGRGAPPTLQRLLFGDLPLLLKTLTPARWQLLASLRARGPTSVRALAKYLERDYKNVHTDVAQLAQLG